MNSSSSNRGPGRVFSDTREAKSKHDEARVVERRRREYLIGSTPTPVSRHRGSLRILAASRLATSCRDPLAINAPNSATEISPCVSEAYYHDSSSRDDCLAPRFLADEISRATPLVCLVAALSNYSNRGYYGVSKELYKVQVCLGVLCRISDRASTCLPIASARSDPGTSIIATALLTVLLSAVCIPRSSDYAVFMAIVEHQPLIPSRRQWDQRGTFIEVHPSVVPVSTVS